ncbi:glycosyltransferase family 2 protein [Pedobacter antarcticus]|uniref:glycosyltransferase family 2 protein n=1 Tax=Pedobacter antarcticus TaxID=34086 RepID=UPI002930C4FA|nr:glycosyltransferase family 2 protein [Pedobacter antarcticus]
MDFKFSEITLLITHYNRSKSLERLLETMVKLNCYFFDIIVSDDGSKDEHLSYLRDLKKTYKFTLVTTDINKGLGNNINKGQDAVKSPYTLYIQEDFIPQDLFPEKLRDAFSYMESDPKLDMARFYAYVKYPNLVNIGNGFATMVFNPYTLDYQKFYYYSDHPHLRRSTFFEKFGRYREGVKSDYTEYCMMMSVLKNKGKSIYYTNFRDLFLQENSSAEPSTVKREFWRQNDNPVLRVVRDIYRYTKFNYNLLIK